MSSGAPAPSSGHTSRAKDPAIVREAQKPLGWIRNIFGWLAAGLVIVAAFSGIHSCREKAEVARKTAEAAQKATEEERKRNPPPPAPPAASPYDPAYPRSGEEKVTRTIGAKAWLDTFSTQTRVSGPVEYRSVDHPGLVFKDRPGVREPYTNTFRSLPTGRYEIFADGDGEVKVIWQ